MSKRHVEFGHLNPYFPYNKKPDSLADVKEIIISNLKLNGSIIIMYLSIHDDSKNVRRHLPYEEDIISFTLEHPGEFDSLLFVIYPILNSKSASFDLELVSH